jgi:hypothetical protein
MPRKARLDVPGALNHIDENNYLLALIRYIHLNPVRAGIVKTMEELDRYPWSGHSAIMGKKECPWLDENYVLLQFNDTRRNARNAYWQFIHDGIGMGHKPELTGGGLVRSLGGWSQVQSSQRKGQKKEYDERILGSGDFVTAIFKEEEEKQIRQFKIKRTGLTITGIIENECKIARISEKELANGSKRTIARNVREKIARRCVEELGMTSAEIARNLGVCTSTVTRALLRGENAA